MPKILLVRVGRHLVAQILSTNEFNGTSLERRGYKRERRREERIWEVSKKDIDYYEK